MPIQKLPTELLAEIFDAYANQYRPCELHWSPEDKYNDLVYLMRVPTDVGAVCQDWRNIAFSTPTLWRILLLQSPNDADAIAKVEERIQRSGDLTLSLYVSETEDLSEECSGRPLESFIDRHSHRWVHVQLDIRQYSHKYPLGVRLGHSGCMFPYLHRIALGPLSAYGHYTLQATTETFPRLTSIAVSQLDVFAIQAPWNQLTTLDLHYVDLPETIFALNDSPRLLHLRIVIVFYEASGRGVQFSTGPILLPQLQTLDIMCQAGTMNLSLLLDHIQAPKLKRFRCQTTADVLCPWTKGSPNGKLDVLVPSPGTSCPDLIVIGRTGVDDDPTFDLDFVQTYAPYSHIIHLHSFQGSTRWMYTRDAIPPLWGDLSHLCRRCLLHEEGNDSEGGHPTGVSFYPPKIGHIMDTPCALCQFHHVADVN